MHALTSGRGRVIFPCAHTIRDMIRDMIREYPLSEGIFARGFFFLISSALECIEFLYRLTAVLLPRMVLLSNTDRSKIENKATPALDFPAIAPDFAGVARKKSGGTRRRSHR